LAEAPQDPHNLARETFVDVGGVRQPAPAPRFSKTPASTPAKPPGPGDNTDEVLAFLGYDRTEVSKLRESGAVV
ncbi:MAG TPA: CoA transferase, partial [Acidimicrobiia bacterium]|nr:CoA transferase [Acidimicrobiia bacterium]